jgi:hypothetical protein
MRKKSTARECGLWNFDSSQFFVLPVFIARERYLQCPLDTRMGQKEVVLKG